MKKIYTLLVFTFITIGIFAAPVSIESAKKAGQNFLTTNNYCTFYKKSIALELAYTSFSNEINNNIKQTNYFYIFNTADKSGFVVIAADDDVSPILGYSDNSFFNNEKIPVNFTKWIESYKEEIRYIISKNIKATPEIEMEWYNLKNGIEKKILFKKAAVSPLVQTRWDQSPYYNALCPYDYSEGERTVTGCVATAMAQVMKFWNYPKTGSGFHSYKHSYYGTLSANFGTTTYNWSSMPNRVTSSNTAVATLMYHCGVSVDMDYGLAKYGGSGAYTEDVADALKEYFGYASSVEAKHRSDYTESQWISLLKTELDAGRPIQYAGSGTNGGHSFVCDGYDNSNYFHMNWGWDGNSDGYFKISALNPGSLGTGGGSGGFNSYQKAIIGIKPPSGNVSSDLIISADVYASASSVNYGSTFTVYTNITNKASSTFYGTYSAALFDESNQFVDYVDSLVEKDGLPPNYTYTNELQFKYKGSYTLLPGTYTIYMFYRPQNGNWIQIHSSGSYDESTTIKITNASTIEIYSDMSVSPATLVKGKNADIILNLANVGSSTFYGQYQLNLYNLDGSFAETINTFNENSGLPSKYSYSSPFLKFSKTEITSAPGTYLLALIYKPNSSSSWYLAGSTYKQNPIKVNIAEPPISPDIYEVNNTKSQSYILPITFSGTTSIIKTSGSNCHVGNDYDYYRINLNSGYKYKITPRLQDMLNSNDGKTYSLDAVFSYSTDGINWSDAYDYKLDDYINITGESTVYFLVSPYFTGDIGNYQLDLEIVRSPEGSVKGFDELADLVNVYPNPSNNFVYLSFKNAKPVTEHFTIEDITGKSIQYKFDAAQSQIKIDIADLNKGIYFLKIETDRGIVCKKIFKN
ncbi:MAG: thiol protease/hemagglutinin PrtT [Bacteroidetes bacterium]|nr:thiol protease/hemagglutinin PrtT [Bacteroidota bacterium]